MGFKQFDLHPNILKAVIACGYNQPTPVQQQAIKTILCGNDIIVSAPTGTGKTAAFVLPILQHLITQKPDHDKVAKVLVLAPTRELASQITQVTNKYAKFMHVNVVNLIGGMNYHQQKRQLAARVDIIVATPGRLLDYMENHRLDLSHVEILVLDEADRMLDMGFIGDVKKIVAVTKKQRQTLLFSATADDKLISILCHLLKDPVRINLTPKETIGPSIKQELYLTNDNDHKRDILFHFLVNENIFKAIIFTATKRKADRLARELQEQGYSTEALHGDLKQSARNRTLTKLRNGKIQYLIATDVAARGIDVFDITHVINFDLPRSTEDYIHRIGRTGRAGKNGIAISLALPEDMGNIRQIEKLLGQKIPLLTIAGLEPKEFPKTNGMQRKKRPTKKTFGRKKSDAKKSYGKTSGTNKQGKDNFQAKRPGKGRGKKGFN